MAKKAKTIPKVGDPFFFHGERHTVASVDKERGRVVIEHPARDESHTLLADQLVQNDNDEWFLPGRTDVIVPGQGPKLTTTPPARS